MSIATQITRIQTDRNTIRNKLIELGLANATDNLDVLAEAIDSIVDRGDISATVKEGETYTIPAGYHSGSGTVSGVAGGGNYTLQSKTNITPTKKQQTITPDDGYYGLSDVIVKPIPDAYQDVTSVTAGAADVLTGKVIVSNTGVVTAGTMDNNGAVSKTLTTSDASYTVPKGYHSGSGKVQIVPEDKSVTPTKSAQNITATAGKVLNKVTVNAIPDNFIDTTDANATAAQIMAGKTAYVNTVKVEGTMPVNEATEHVLDVSEQGNVEFVIEEGYHDGTGTVIIDPQSKTVSPWYEPIIVTPDAGRVLDKVTVEAIPISYQDISMNVNVAPENLLEGVTVVGEQGALIDGTIPRNGAMNKTIDGLTTTSVTIPAGYTTGGTVSLTSDIEAQLAAI